MLNIKKLAIGFSAGAIMLGAALIPAIAETLPSIDFESPTYFTGNINGQDGWSKTGGYDSEVASVASFANAAGFGFGDQALRISNAVTSGSFGDQTISPALASPAGEVGESHYEASFDIGSPQATQQPGLFLSVSPDDGNGSRMSYAGFDDRSDGIHVIFYDVTNPGPLGTVSSFNGTDVATIDRTSAHSVKFVIDFVPGPANDVVKLYVDGGLVHTGTTWEDYYRYDPEQNGNGNVLFPIDSLILPVRGTAAPGTSGNGYLIDNVSLESSTPLTVVSSMNGGGHILKGEGKRKDMKDISFGGWVNEMSDNSFQGEFEVNFHNVGDSDISKGKFHSSEITDATWFPGVNDCEAAMNVTMTGSFNGESGYTLVFRSGDDEDSARFQLSGPDNYDSNTDFGNESNCVGTARADLDNGNININL